MVPKMVEEDGEATTAAEHELEDLLGEVLDAQDAEWRRMAAELHDTTAQHLTAVLMGIDRAVSVGQDRGLPLMEQARRLVDQSLREIRALCYRLHPPMLEELGLRPALSWLVRSVQQDSGMVVSLRLPPNLGRLPLEVETGLFRLVQAELAGLRRRSGIARMEITLKRWNRGVVLTMKVTEPGVRPAFELHEAAELAAGIGGVRARVHQIGGALRIDSSPLARRIAILVPLPSPQRPDRGGYGSDPLQELQQGPGRPGDRVGDGLRDLFLD